ncbi:sensor histidine kinase [Roseivivax sp. CAU 1761]
MNHPAAARDMEALRIAALQRYGVLDTAREAAFDRITALAVRLLKVPAATISLVDSDRIWFKSTAGLDHDLSETPRRPGLCATAIQSNAPRVLADARRDPSAAAHPLVTGPFGLRFYAGVPLCSREGQLLGTLCVLDRVPREISAPELETLHDLAALVMDRLELGRDASEAAARRHEEMRATELMASEIEHRMMNSLQLVASIARRKAARHGGIVAEELRDIAARVAAIAQASRHIQQSLPDPWAPGDLALFLRVLSKELFPLCPQGGLIELDCAELALPRDKLVAIGHLVTELVLNAMKSGATRIYLSARPHGDALRIEVADDGCGLPPDFDPSASKGLGMAILAAMEQKLGGAAHWLARDGGGTLFRLDIPHAGALAAS